MANIFDYLKDVAHDSFYDFPLNELDILALTEATYLSFDNLVSAGISTPNTVFRRPKRNSTCFASGNLPCASTNLEYAAKELFKTKQINGTTNILESELDVLASPFINE